jgi:putative radical SAM enzyme (TIGR03279 family)
MGGIISVVEPGSPAAAAGVQAGDHLLTVNGRPLADLIDYYFAAAEQQLTLSLRRAGCQELTLKLEKESGADIGLSFTSEVFDGIRRCRNKCLFCFVDQLQPQPRESLLIKDDDYRMSFLEGNFISGVNLNEADFQRIQELRLSPLYISVHATDAALRGRLLGRKRSAPVLPLLTRLIDYGVTLHTQIVLVPGFNDGAALEQTVAELARLFPGVASIGLVPLGLTRFQQRPELRLGTAEEAAAVLERLLAWQKEFRKRYGTRLLFAADEFYIRANQPFPAARHYEEFAQLENGIGMAALFAEEWKGCLRRYRGGWPGQDYPKTALVTGQAGAAALAPLMPEIERLTAGAVTLLPLENRFYGPSVTVSGLLTGSCLAAALPRGVFARYIIPDCMLKHGSTLFLDDMSVEDLALALQTPFTVAQSNAKGLLAALTAGDARKNPF